MNMEHLSTPPATMFALAAIHLAAAMEERPHNMWAGYSAAKKQITDVHWDERDYHILIAAFEAIADLQEKFYESRRQSEAEEW